MSKAKKNRPSTNTTHNSHRHNVRDSDLVSNCAAANEIGKQSHSACNHGIDIAIRPRQPTSNKSHSQFSGLTVQELFTDVSRV